MQNWSLKVKWTQPKLGNLLWAETISSGNWQSSYRTHIHAHQFNAIKACTFLKCWGRICRIDLWRWNEHNRSLATYCELETCRVIDNLPIALILTHTNSMRSKPVRFWSVEAGYAELIFEGENEHNQSLATYCELETCRVIDNLPIALSLTHTNWMRSKPVRFWSVEAGYAELIFEGEMKTTEAWQPTVSSKRVG